MSHNAIKHKAIRASAGTGKTYNLAMRYIRLLQNKEADPASIVALTFSNKAAGEILDKIIAVLLELIEKEGKIQEAVSQGYILPDSTPDDFKAILQKLLACRERLQISTIDSFFMQILQGVPIECGIAGNITMIEEEDDRPRLQALFKLFASADETTRKQLLEHIKKISYGNDEKSLKKAMKKLLRSCYPVYLDNPDPALWEKNLCPAGAQKLSEDALKMITDELADETFLMANGVFAYNKKDGKEVGGDFRKHFQNLARMAKKYEHVREIDEAALEHLLTKPFGENPEMLFNNEPRTFTLSFNKNQYELSEILCSHLRALIKHLLFLECNYVTRKTQALYEIFQDFDKTYAESTRNAGHLTFNDIACLIRENPSNDSLPYDIQTLEERIDAKINHYMIDEFQDTSDRQWDVLSNLVDEAIQSQDEERDRSFFFVGDIKQSIYQWRQGNPELFQKILDYYNRETIQIREEPLTQSYRSSEPVIETVNRVFHDKPAENPLNPLLQSAVKKMQFEEHSSAEAAAAQPGCTMLLELPEKDNLEMKADAIKNLLDELKPFDRTKPLTVGILVRSNTFGRDLADLLIEKYKLNVTVDGKLVPAQSLAFSAYRQMLRLAAHPGDEMAQAFLKMLRFGGQEIKLPTAEEIRNLIDREGFYGFTRSFIDTFKNMDTFDLSRIRAIEAKALSIDQEGSMTIDEYLEELVLFAGAGSSMRNTIQIMTIHKSKGLDFNIVIMPETSTDKGNMLKHRLNSDSLAIRKQKTESSKTAIDWISFLPNKAFIPLIEEFKDFSDEENAATCYESLCNLYVAMTRARNALYIFNDKPTEKSTTYQHADFLADMLAGKTPESSMEQAATFVKEKLPGLQFLYANGNPEWIKKLDEAKKEQKEEDSPTPSEYEDAAKEEKKFCRNLHDTSHFTEIIRSVRPGRIKPSADHDSDTKYVFSDQAAANLGTRLHEILADFTFYSGRKDVDDLLAQHETTGEEEKLLNTFFQFPAIQDILKEPEGPCELWREKRFLANMETGIVNGCFDRVLIRKDKNGVPVSADIMDYKSDRDVTEESLKERHGAQLDLYRQVLTKLTGISPDRIRCTLLSVRYGFTVTF